MSHFCATHFFSSHNHRHLLLIPHQLRNYKRLIAQMHLLTQEKEDLPADYAWDTPYKTMELDALRDKVSEKTDG
jgi:hypothetical protein